MHIILQENYTLSYAWITCIFISCELIIKNNKYKVCAADKHLLYIKGCMEILTIIANLGSRRLNQYLIVVNRLSLVFDCGK